MTALSKDRKLITAAGGAARTRVGKVAADAVIYAGAAVCRNATGYLVPADDTSTLQFVGWAEQAADATGLDDGDIEVRYITAVAALMENDGTHPITQGDLYKPCYIEDDQTVRSTVGNGVIAGTAEEITPAGKILVFGAPELATLAPSGEADLAKMFVLTDVDAKGTNNVHALIDSTGITAVTSGITNPDVPRNLRVVKSSSWDGGTVTVIGTDQYDDPVTEVFPALGAGTEVGVKIFKTVTSVQHSIALDGGAGYSVGTGDKLGIVGNIAAAEGFLWAGTTAEAVVVDATYDAFTPTTAPDNSVDFTFITNIVVASE